MRDWADTHLVFHKWDWRQKISYALYMIGDWLMGEHSHDLVIRDGAGNPLMHANGRCLTYSMPPLPYSVWCCDGRIDNGEGGIRDNEETQ